MITAFLSNMLILGGLAVLAAVVLYLTSRRFAVEKSPEADAVYTLLPQANCGACGYAGCRDFAENCARADKEKFSHLRCPVGGERIMAQIAAIRGFDAATEKQTCAVLHCNGTCQNAPDKIAYTGMKSCRLANMVMSGQSGCPNGCLRFGDCVGVCRFGALTIDKEQGIPVIDPAKCTSCGACVKRCPRGLFEIRPIKDNSQVYVACSNRQKGAVARKNCHAACIACGKCAKLVPLIKVEDNLAHIPAEVSAAEYGSRLAEGCPTGAIWYRTGLVTETEHEN